MIRTMSFSSRRSPVCQHSQCTPCAFQVKQWRIRAWRRKTDWEVQWRVLGTEVHAVQWSHSSLLEYCMSTIVRVSVKFYLMVFLLHMHSMLTQCSALENIWMWFGSVVSGFVTSALTQQQYHSFLCRSRCYFPTRPGSQLFDERERHRREDSECLRLLVAPSSESHCHGNASASSPPVWLVAPLFDHCCMTRCILKLD